MKILYIFPFFFFFFGKFPQYLMLTNLKWTHYIPYGLPHIFHIDSNPNPNSKSIPSSRFGGIWLESPVESIWNTGGTNKTSFLTLYFFSFFKNLGVKIVLKRAGNIVFKYS